MHKTCDSGVPMLIEFVFTVSSLVSVLICLLTGCFDTFAWLWAMPVSFIGCFAVLAGLIFLFVYICGQAVDTEKPQETDSKFYRLIINLIAEAAIPILSVSLTAEGLEKTPKDGRFLLVCNHICDFDPIMLLHCFPKSQLTFVSKQENRNMFLVGQYMHKIMCPLINRENDREALKAILQCIQILKEDKASVAIFPEGYIHPDRKLHRFRNGVFKIAQKAGVPIVVCTLRNTQLIPKNYKKLKKSHVQLHLLEVITPEQYQGMTTVDLGNRIYEMMAKDLGPENVSAEV